MLFRLSWEYLKPRMGTVVIILILQLAQSLASLWLPSLNADIINDGVLQADIPRIWSLGGIMLAVTVFQGLAIAGAIYLGAKLAMGLGYHLRARMFSQVSSFGRTEIYEFGPSSLITRSTNDVSQVQMVVHMTFTVMVMAPIMGVGGVIMAMRQDIVLSGLFIVIIPVLAIFMIAMMVRLGPLYDTQQKRIDAINRILREQLTGVRVIRAFLRQRSEHDRFEKANDEMKDVWLKIGTTWAFMMPVVQVIIGLATVAIIWFGGHRIDTGGMQVGSLIAFINYLMQILMSVMMAAMMFMMVPRARVSARRIAAVLDTKQAIVSPDNPKAMAPSPAPIELEDVTVSYPGAEAHVLHNVSLTLNPGTTTAVVGSTGSGKSTLVHLLTRMLDPVSGSVRMGGADLREADLAELRSRVALVPQKAYLFSGSIASTITGQRGETQHDTEGIWEALEAAQASEFVSKLSDGLDHHVDPGGRNFSGGQRQRLTIARALYRARQGVDLVVFDDSFSALDGLTDQRLRASLPDAVGQAAVLIVAQRISSIRHADKILVLDDGRAVGYGNHEELLATCGTYQEIVESQAAIEEDA